MNTRCSAKDPTKILLLHSDLIKIFCCRPHFFPGLVQQLDADGKQLLKCTVMGEKHGMIVIPAFIGFRKKQKPQPREHIAQELLRVTEVHYSDRILMVYNSINSKRLRQFNASPPHRHSILGMTTIPMLHHASLCLMCLFHTHLPK